MVADVPFRSNIIADVFCVVTQRLTDVSSVCPLQHSLASGSVTVSIATTGQERVPKSVTVISMVAHGVRMKIRRMTCNGVSQNF